MIVINTEQELNDWVGHELGVSGWFTIDQSLITRFAEVTGDHQWIHVDEERAAASDFGATIAHGFLLVSLLPQLRSQLFSFGFADTMINYGSDKVRFLAPVRAGSRVRLRVMLTAVESKASGTKIFTENSLEVEGQQRVAMLATMISLAKKKAQI